MLEGEGAWMPHVTLGKIRASKAQIGAVSCNHATLQSLVPTAPAMPQGLTLLGERPPRIWCDWDAALEFQNVVTFEGTHAMDESEECAKIDTNLAEESLPQQWHGAKIDANLAEESLPEQLHCDRPVHSELVKDASQYRLPGDLFVTCKVQAVSATRKQGRFLVEVQRRDSGACMQVVGTRSDVGVGQVWLIALPGATLEDGQQVKQAKIAGEWSEGALVEIIPEVASGSLSHSCAKEVTNNQLEDERVPRGQSGNACEHSAFTTGEYRVLSGTTAAADLRNLPVIEANISSDGDLLHHVTGDATAVQYGKGPKIIAHVCNDRGRWGKGFVMAISDKWPEAARKYRQWHKAGAKEGFGLGAVQLVELTPSLTLANMIGQNGIKTGSKGPPVRYNAIGEALMAVAAHAVSEGASIHMPRIGTGLAGGEWQQIESLLRIVLESYSVHVYVYEYNA